MKKLRRLECPACGAKLNIMNAVNGTITCEYCRTGYVVEEEDLAYAANEEATPKTDSAQNSDWSNRSDHRQTEEAMNTGDRGEYHASNSTVPQDNVQSHPARRLPKELGIFCIMCYAAYLVTGLPVLKFLGIIALIACIVSFIIPSDPEAKRRQYEKLGVRVSPKNKWIAFTLCFFFGVFGIHYFYTGRIGRGVICLLTFDFFAIGYVIDLIVILCGRFKDYNHAVLI